jgi:hypothetical protein
VMRGFFKKKKSFFKLFPDNWRFFHKCGLDFWLLKFIFKKVEAFVKKCEAFIFREDIFREVEAFKINMRIS